MPYIVVDNFAGGLDDRKTRLTAAPGTLTRLNNAHLTAGGEIEKRKRFYPLYQFSTLTQCIGGKSAYSERVYLYGNGPKPSRLPWIFDWIDVTQHPYSFGDAVKLRSVEYWGNTPYALVEYASGDRLLWFGTTPILLNQGANWGYETTGRYARDMIIMSQKAYLVQESVLYASGVAEPTKFGLDGLSGTALFDVSHYGPKAFDLTAMSAYQNRLITMSDKASVIWDLDPDPDLTSPVQFIDNFGTEAPRSLVAYGEADMFFLSSSGVRSVRARDSSNIATLNDVGSPINHTVTRAMRSAWSQVPNAIGAYEPADGRYWLALWDTIYVLSFFPSSKVTAWSTYTPPGPVTDMFDHNGTLIMLSNGGLYSYGALPVRQGTPAGGTKVPYPLDEYDDTVVEVELPYIDAEKPANRKNWSGFDAALEGRWNVHASFDINRPATEDPIANIKRSTYDEPRFGVAGESTHLKLRLETAGSGYARLSNVCVHFTNLGAD